MDFKQQILTSFFGGVSHVDFYIVLFLITILLLVKYDKVPQVESIRRFTSMLDDRGGNILVLLLLTVWFFSKTVSLFYWAFGSMASGYIKADNAILILALNTVSAGAFGTCFGALLKTMNGSMTVAPPNATTGGGTPIPPYPSLASPSGVVEANIEAHIGGTQHAQHA